MPGAAAPRPQEGSTIGIGSDWTQVHCHCRRRPCSLGLCVAPRGRGSPHLPTVRPFWKHWTCGIFPLLWAPFGSLFVGGKGEEGKVLSDPEPCVLQGRDQPRSEGLPWVPLLCTWSGAHVGSDKGCCLQGHILDEEF